VLSSMCYAVRVWSQPNRQSLSNRENAPLETAGEKDRVFAKCGKAMGGSRLHYRPRHLLDAYLTVIFNRMFGA
jgi:hypothetical protein